LQRRFRAYLVIVGTSPLVIYDVLVDLGQRDAAFEKVVVVCPEADKVHQLVTLEPSLVNYPLVLIADKGLGIYHAYNVALRFLYSCETIFKVQFVNSGDALLRFPAWLWGVYVTMPTHLIGSYFLIVDSVNYLRRRSSCTQQLHTGAICFFLKSRDNFYFDQNDSVYADGAFIDRTLTNGVVFIPFWVEFTYGGISTVPTFNMSLRLFAQKSSKRYRYLIKFLCRLILGDALYLQIFLKKNFYQRSEI